MLIQGSWIICEFIKNKIVVTSWEMEEKSNKADFEFFFFVEGKDIMRRATLTV